MKQTITGNKTYIKRTILPMTKQVGIRSVTVKEIPAQYEDEKDQIEVTFDVDKETNDHFLDLLNKKAGKKKSMKRKKLNLTVFKEQLRKIIREEIQKLNELAWSSIEARDQVESDMSRISKILGKASQQTIKIMMGGVKGGRYDAMDLSKSIEIGPAKLTHAGERDFMRVLWTKVRDGFRRYSKRGKLR